jgi:uncharacterized protein (DUF885 family)
MFRAAAAILLSATIMVPATAAAVEAPPVLADLVDDIGRTMLVRYPEEVTDLGLSGELGLDDSALNDLSPEYLEQTAQLARSALERLAAVDAAALTPDEQVTLAITEWYLDDVATMADFADHEYAVNFITGPHVNLPEFMADVHPLDERADAEAYAMRLRAAGAQLRQVADNLARAEAAGNLPTARGLDIAQWQIGNQIGSAIAHPLVADLETRLASTDLAGEEREAVIGAARDAVDSAVVPAYRALLEAVKLSAARSDGEPGVLHHSNGDDYYAAALRHHTTTSSAPQEVHDLGLVEVERARAELTEALAAAGFDPEVLGLAQAVGMASASIPAVPLMSGADRDALLEATEQFIAESEAAFGNMFVRRPAAAIEVRRPRPDRESAAGAYYRPPPASGERPGIYYLALGGDAFAMDTYATTNYHEAVPGHHFQIALQREADELPLLQRATTFTGYAEGWALYAERLAYEAGLYEDDPLGNIGRLRMELLRAARVVADTGIHHLGWSRTGAIDYLVELGFPEPWAASEVDRYIVWPGQAPAYLVGMLEILRLREEAQATLGDDFDIAAFHDAVLRHGSMPLEVLPMAVEAYVDSAIN